MKANVGLSSKAQAGLVESLNHLLADEYVLYTKTRNYHWNVTGPHFNDLHKFFESQYDTLDVKIDEIAEFIRYFGEKVPATLANFQRAARLKENTGTSSSGQQMVADLLKDHEALISTLRSDVEEAEKAQASEVADYLTGLVEEHSKMAWMLRSMLE
jgi:starvation-inducible DNA-binding protein